VKHDHYSRAHNNFLVNLPFTLSLSKGERKHSSIEDHPLVLSLSKHEQQVSPGKSIGNLP
jgi:hypothetical protein